jgi:hypothetical protein
MEAEAERDLPLLPFFVPCSVQVFPLANINRFSLFDLGLDVVTIPMLLTESFPWPQTEYCFSSNQRFRDLHHIMSAVELASQHITSQPKLTGP